MNFKSIDEKSEVLKTLDLLAVALADHSHVWTVEERESYEKAVRRLSEKSG